MKMSDVDRLAQEALQSVKTRSSTGRSVAKSTTALISLHSRLLAGKIADPNLITDKNGICIQKKEAATKDAEVKPSNSLMATAPVIEKKKDKKTNAGKDWFNIEPLPLTEEIRKDIKMITMRNYLDPKRFYKKADKIKTVLGVGTVIEGSAEYKSSRMSKKERKTTFLDEIMADQELKCYTKRKYSEIQNEKAKTARKFKRNQSSGRGKKTQLKAYF